NDRSLRPELNSCCREIWRHHPNDIIVVEETVEKADERYPDVSCPLEPHMWGIEKHDKGTSRIRGMPQVLDCLRCSVFDNRQVGGGQVLNRSGVQRRVTIESDRRRRDGFRVVGCGGNLRGGGRRSKGDSEQREVPTSAHSSYTAEISSECKTPWVKSQTPNPNPCHAHETLGLGTWELGCEISHRDPSSSRARIAVRTRSISRSRSSNVS